MLTNIPVSPKSPSIIEGNLKDWVFPKSREKSVKGGEKVGAPVLTLIIWIVKLTFAEVLPAKDPYILNV